MHFLHVNSEKDVGIIDKMIKKGNDVFILVYMTDCGPCNATRPEWEKLELALKEQYSKNNNIFVIDVNKDYLSSIKHIGDVDGFPTMKYISANGSIVETYESSAVKKKDRSVSSFINWIESKINSLVSTTPTSSAHNVYKRLSKTRKHRAKGKKTQYRKKQTGGKWSRKYKSSINCNKPKGFSQKQYCKYGRNK